MGRSYERERAYLPTTGAPAFLRKCIVSNPKKTVALTKEVDNRNLSMRGILSALALFGVLLSTRADIKTELVASGFSRPLFAVSPPGETNRLFILEEHTGRIRIIDLTSNTVKATPFLTVTNLLAGNEQGLLGLAFHPDYRTNGYFYIDQVASGGGPAGHTEVSRFRVIGDPATSDLADPSSKKVLLTIDQPQENHNGGWVAFGPDGFLYISTGDGGGAYDQHGGSGNGQSRMTLLGKILRIDVDTGDTYGIPPGNPYRIILSLRSEIWAFGLRNPWRCSFDRMTGHLWVGDVGQDTREEIDVIPAGVGGLNFGWRPREGTIQTPFAAYAKETPVTPAVEPVYDYAHPTGNSVTGGYVYRGSKVPELQGNYLFGDYVSGRFWKLTPDPSGTNGTVTEITAQLNPSPRQITSLSSFGEDGAGELYICDLTSGRILRIVSSTPTGLQLVAARSGTGDLRITFNAQNGQNYLLESAELLMERQSGVDPWKTITNVPASTARSVTLDTPVTGTHQYFRLRVP